MPPVGGVDALTRWSLQNKILQSGADIMEAIERETLMEIPKIYQMIGLQIKLLQISE